MTDFFDELTAEAIGRPLISSRRYSLIGSSALQQGKELRDHQVWKYPILPGAVFAFQSIVAARSWHIGGRPDAVMEALDFFHGAVSKNTVTGCVEHGLETLIKRLVPDYLLVGRMMMAVPNINPALTYLDPTTTLLSRSKEKWVDKNGVASVPLDSERIWDYDGRYYRSDEVYLHHPVPIGANNFIAPVAWIIPIAELAWLIHEHHRASVDGRKIRNLFFIPVGWREQVSNAVNDMVAIYSGANAAKNGVPIIEYKNTNGQSVADMLYLLELSKLSQNFNEEQFNFMWVNVISGATGVTARHFWNDDRSSNRALEIVQEARQQQKGPAAFIRSLQRIFNNSRMLEAATGDSEVRMQFIEEVDTASMEAKAKVISLYAEAVDKLKTTFGVTITLDSFLAWLQRDAGVPVDLQLQDVDGNELGSEDVTRDADVRLMLEEDIGRMDEVDAVAMPEVKNIKMRPKQGEIVVDADGNVIDVHRKYMFIGDLISDISKSKREKREQEIKAVREEVLASEDKDTEEITGMFQRLTYGRILESINSLYEEKSTVMETMLPEDRTAYLQLSSGMSIVPDRVKSLEKFIDSLTKVE